MRKLRVVGLTLFVVLMAGVLEPQAQQQFAPGRDAFAFESITVSATSIGLTAATVSPATAPAARQAFCTAEAASATALRYRMDGVAPTAAIGHWVQAGVPGTSAPGIIQLEGTNTLLQFRAIRGAAVDVTLRCTLSR